MYSFSGRNSTSFLKKSIARTHPVVIEKRSSGETSNGAKNLNGALPESPPIPVFKSKKNGHHLDKSYLLDQDNSQKKSQLAPEVIEEYLRIFKEEWDRVMVNIKNQKTNLPHTITSTTNGSEEAASTNGEKFNLEQWRMQRILQHLYET